MTATFFGRHVHYFADEHRIVTDPLITMQLTHFSHRMGLASPIWLSPELAARRGVTLRCMSAPLNLWAACYGETFCSLPSKLAALRICRDVSDAQHSAVRQGIAMTNANPTWRSRVFLLSAVALPVSMTGAAATATTPAVVDRKSSSHAPLTSPRAWVLCPRELQAFFLAGHRRCQQSRHSLSSSLPPEQFWVSEHILRGEYERQQQRQDLSKVPATFSRPGLAGVHSDEMTFATGTPTPSPLPLPVIAGLSRGAVTTPFVYKTLINTDQLLYSPEVNQLVATEYETFFKTLESDAKRTI